MSEKMSGLSGDGLGGRLAGEVGIDNQVIVGFYARVVGSVVEKNVGNVGVGVGRKAGLVQDRVWREGGGGFWHKGATARLLDETRQFDFNPTRKNLYLLYILFSNWLICIIKEFNCVNIWRYKISYPTFPKTRNDHEILRLDIHSYGGLISNSYACPIDRTESKPTYPSPKNTTYQSSAS